MALRSSAVVPAEASSVADGILGLLIIGTIALEKCGHASWRLGWLSVEIEHRPAAGRAGYSERRTHGAGRWHQLIAGLVRHAV